MRLSRRKRETKATEEVLIDFFNKTHLRVNITIKYYVQGQNIRGGRGTDRGGRGGRGGRVGFSRDGEDHENADDEQEGDSEEKRNRGDFKKEPRGDRPQRDQRPPFKDQKGEKKGGPKYKNADASEEAKKAAPVKQPDIIAKKPQNEVAFDGWGGSATFF